MKPRCAEAYQLTNRADLSAGAPFNQNVTGEGKKQRRAHFVSSLWPRQKLPSANEGMLHGWGSHTCAFILFFLYGSLSRVVELQGLMAADIETFFIHLMTEQRGKIIQGSLWRPTDLLPFITLGARLFSSFQYHRISEEKKATKSLCTTEHTRQEIQLLY